MIRLDSATAALVLLASCVSSSPREATRPAERWKPDEDVLGLSRIWQGDKTKCAEGPPSKTPITPIGSEAPTVQTWNCVVPLWKSVSVYSAPGLSNAWDLRAQNDNPNLCVPERFSSHFDIAQSMMSNIVSSLVAALHDGPFAGTDLALTVDFVRGGCDILIPHRVMQQRTTAESRRKLR